MCHQAFVGAILRDRPALVFKDLIPGGHGGPPLQTTFSEVTTEYIRIKKMLGDGFWAVPLFPKW
jgi:hypothetical protein